MSYLVTFADKTSKRITDREGPLVLQALAKQQGVIVGGAFYAYHVISTCRPLRVWAEEQQESARSSGKYFCRYGHTHDRRRECACKDAGLEPIEEITGLFPRLAAPAPEEPQTPEEKRRAEEWEHRRTEFIDQRTIKPGLAEHMKGGAVANCDKCNGTGNWLFSGTYIVCSCVTGR